MRRHATRRPMAEAIVAIVATACAAPSPPAFDAHRGDDSSRALADVLSRLAITDANAEVRGATGAPRIVAATRGGEPALVALDLVSGRVRWRVAVPSATRPEILGDVVLVTTADAWVAIDADTGHVLWRLTPPDPVLFGAARSGTRLFMATGSRDPAAVGHLVALDARNGTSLWTREAPAPLGRPVARGGFVWVPWQRQYLAVLDAADGRERARLRATDHAVEWVDADAAGIVFGDREFMRLTPRYDGTRAASPRLALPIDELPGSPALHPSAFAPLAPVGSVHGRIGIHYALDGSPGVRLWDDRYYFVFYRAVLAFNLAGHPLWARVLDDDVVAAAAAPGGLVAVLASGRVLPLAAQSGADGTAFDFGVALDAADIDATGFAIPASAAPPASPRSGLLSIAIDGDARLLPVRAFAVRQLAALPAPEATRDLLDVYAQRNAPPELLRVVADALQARAAGSEHLVDALATHYDFLERTQPAPLPVIVPALVRARETRAVAGLLEWMGDPETPATMLPGIVGAVADLGDASVVQPLHELLRVYRADSAFAQAPDALVAAARGVVRHDATNGRARVMSIADAPDTSPRLAAALRDLLTEADGQVRAPQAVAVAPPPALPALLGPEQIHATFVEHVADLRACVLEELERDPKLLQVRLAFIVEHDGSTHAWSFVPNRAAFADCLYPRVRDYRFPPFRRSRQVATYRVALRPPATVAQPTTPATTHATWWAHARERAPSSADTVARTPWWRMPDVSVIAIDVPADLPHAETAPASTPTPPAAPSSVPTPVVTDEADDRWWVPTQPPASPAH